jgi:hypothetical protein
LSSGEAESRIIIANGHELTDDLKEHRVRNRFLSISAPLDG